MMQILEALKARDMSTGAKITSENMLNEETSNTNSERVSKIVAVLEKLEQVHRENLEDLLEANQDFQHPGISKVGKMRKKIQQARENLGTNEKKTELHLLDQPNHDGNTVMHTTARKCDGAVTRLLLEHGANPNVQNSEGNSPLHHICIRKDIQTATCILKKNGRVLENKMRETPAIDQLFFEHEEEDGKKLMEALGQSNHRKEILEEILRKKHLLFRLVEEEKSEILSILLKKLSKGEKEEYVNLVRDVEDGNTCLHIASSSNSLSCTSILLEAGAKLKTNAAGRLPKIEDFFTEENDKQITSALVDGVVERVEAKQLEEEKALKLLIPDDKERKIHFQRASRKNWALISQWETGQIKKKVDFSEVVPRMSVSELEKMMEVARDGHWEKSKVSALLCAEDKDGRPFLSSLDLQTQTEVAMWNRDCVNQIVHKISKGLLQWIIRQANKSIWEKDKLVTAVSKIASENQAAPKISEELLQWLILRANESNWAKDKLSSAVCRKSPDKRPTLSLFAKEVQKQLVVMDKTRTCQIIPWLGSNLQEWIYQEAVEGRWDQAMVFRVLKREEKEGKQVVFAKIETLGKLNVGMNSIRYVLNVILQNCFYQAWVRAAAAM